MIKIRITHHLLVAGMFLYLSLVSFAIGAMLDCKTTDVMYYISIITTTFYFGHLADKIIDKIKRQ